MSPSSATRSHTGGRLTHRRRRHASTTANNGGRGPPKRARASAAAAAGPARCAIAGSHRPKGEQPLSRLRRDCYTAARQSTAREEAGARSAQPNRLEQDGYAPPKRTQRLPHPSERRGELHRAARQCCFRRQEHHQRNCFAEEAPRCSPRYHWRWPHRVAPLEGGRAPV